MSRLYAICFDVHDGRRGQKIAGELLNFGRRVQYSLFECHLNEQEFAELQRRLLVLAAPEDHIRCYPLCGKDEGKVSCVGGKQEGDVRFILA